MLFKVLKRTIQRDVQAGNTEALEAMVEKVDIFLAADKITIDQYSELVTMMNEALGVNSQE